MKKIKAIDSLRASKIQNSPFNSEILNVEEDVDTLGYLLILSNNFYAAQAVAQRMLPLLTI